MFDAKTSSNVVIATLWRRIFVECLMRSGNTETRRGPLWVIHVGFAESLICPVIGPLRTWRFALEDVGPDVIQAPKREPRIMRYELSDHEWAVKKVQRAAEIVNEIRNEAAAILKQLSTMSV